jgi:penicillin-binding protein 2
MRRPHKDVAPEDIFIDSTNLPAHEFGQFEGNVERPISQRAILVLGIVFLSVVGVFFSRSYALQIQQGSEMAAVSIANTIDSSLVFATRGVVYDRMGKEIAWNELDEAASSTVPYALRKYATMPGLSHLLGWLRYPKSDASGVWWRETYTPMAGIEASFDDFLRGTNGRSMVEADARGRVQRENIVSPAINGTDLHLSIDAELQSELYRVLWRHAQANHFLGGAAVIMDVHTGEVLALTSFPEYDNTAFTEGDSAAVARAYSDERSPVLDRAVSGLFTPGSIVKPMFAAAALKEGVITPEKEIVSTGFISIPNPYEPDKPTIFRDWTVHGPVDMRTAIAVSSDEYFYTIGGGYGTQAGLGIGRIDEYARVFGLAQKTNIALPGEKEGIIPTPEWKVETFGADDPWRIGNTYHTAIGQYGFLITPIQAVRFTAAIANGGQLLTPQLLASSTPQKKSVGISDMHLKVAREGMRMAVTSSRSDATVKSLNIPGVQISAKTGTAQLGNRNQWMNSWSVGFWPSDNPRFAYAVVLEKAPAGTLSGASPGLRPFFEWLLANRPEYVTMRAQE